MRSEIDKLKEVVKKTTDSKEKRALEQRIKTLERGNTVEK